MNRTIPRLFVVARPLAVTFVSAAFFSGPLASCAFAQAAAPAAAAPAAAPQVAAPAPVAVPTTAPASSIPASNTGNAGASSSNVSANQAAQRTGGVEGSTVAEAPSQFQQLVATSTERILPIFGASLFNGVPSTFAPVSDVPVDSGYVIGPGDTLNIQTTGLTNLQYNLTVDRNGAINIPGLGPVHVAGVAFGDLDQFLTRQLSRLYRGFTLTANLGALRSIQVFVVGEARRPGSYSISSLSTLLNAIFASGGPANDGSLRDIQVKRDGKTIVHFDLYDLLLHGNKTQDIRLMSGDVIFIPFVGPQIAVSGSVNTPAIYELKGSTTIRDAVQLAGGETAVASTSFARLERVYEHEMRSVEDVNLETGGGQVLRNGDILTISSIIERFRNAITLRGNVANPGRYTWHEGMRLADLFPDKAALITRDYWSKRNQLGQVAQDYTRTGESSGVGQGSLRLNGTEAERRAENPSVEQNSSTGTNSQATGSATTAATSTTAATGTGAGTSPNTGSRPASVSQAGTTVSSALTGTNTTFPARNDVILSAPDIDWSYAVIERLSTKDLKTVLIPFNLGRLVLEGDASQNMELQPGDVVTVFSTADIRVPTSQQTRFVRLEGEFIAPGVYSVHPGETLRSLLTRAGGFTPDAYLYASEFTRESVRRVQIQRLREYADTLDAQISAVTANNTARAISSADQVAAGASAADARAAVQRLRQIEPIGRIVLDLHPSSSGVASLPDLQLEDGDRFIVPRLPSSVNVEGQVYNANAFVYDDDRRMIDYLHRAGGPDRQADRKRAFILRADGSVVSEQYANVKKSPIFPGDTIVVPPVLDRRAFFQRVVDLAGIVSSFGYSAATLYLISRP